MLRFLEELVSALFNRLQGRRAKQPERGGAVTLGHLVADEHPTREPMTVSATRRTMHMAIFGKTGTGKSSLIKGICLQDIAADRGALVIDLHGDTTEFLLSAYAAEEWKRREHLSHKVVVISPGDPEMSVGLNPLGGGDLGYNAIAEIAELLKRYWGLDRFGARTEELLRNGLFVLAANDLTLLELSPLLTNPVFRANCLAAVANAEVREYFDTRYGAVSEPMRATMREPILNKISAFTADPRFRHIIGQATSTFSLREALDKGYTVIAHLPKGELGPQALTVAGLLFTMAKNALFSRKRRTLYTFVCDEIQNLVSQASDVETVLSEARKFGVGVISANQFLDQHTAPLRAALLSVGTHVCFQLSSADAGTVGQMLDGGKPLTERLKNLPARHFIVKSGADRWVEACAPPLPPVKTDAADFLSRSRAHHARSRREIEAEIAARHAALTRSAKDALHDWD